jgi:hypothetical protein
MGEHTDKQNGNTNKGPLENWSDGSQLVNAKRKTLNPAGASELNLEAKQLAKNQQT